MLRPPFHCSLSGLRWHLMLNSKRRASNYRAVQVNVWLSPVDRCIVFAALNNRFLMEPPVKRSSHFVREGSQSSMRQQDGRNQDDAPPKDSARAPLGLVCLSCGLNDQHKPLLAGVGVVVVCLSSFSCSRCDAGLNRSCSKKQLCRLSLEAAQAIPQPRSRPRSEDS